MKNIIFKLTSLSIVLSLSLIVSSCTEDTLESDASKVIPYITSLTGPVLAYQSSTVTYTITKFRGGSEYIWTVTGAKMQPILGRPDQINVFFDQGVDPVTISVYEKASNGKASEAKSMTVDVICNPAPGDYIIKMHDSYGDGWQTDDPNGGNGITVNIDGIIIEFGMCNPYVEVDYSCVSGDYSDAETTVNIPVGTISAVWTFPGDKYGEISFEIYAPDGTLAFESGAPGNTTAGQLPIVVCKP